VIINCTGLGSRELARDSNMYPVKGQLLKMETDKKVTDFLYFMNLSVKSDGSHTNFYYIPQYVLFYSHLTALSNNKMHSNV